MFDWKWGGHRAERPFHPGLTLSESRDRVADAFATPLPLVYIPPRLYCAGAYPWSAALRNHFAASSSSFTTP